MTKLKKLFAGPRRTALTLVCLLAILALLGAGTVFAAGAIAESSSIGGENALHFACADAGADPAAIRGAHTEFDFEQGQFVYEVEFLHDGTAYEYWIKASDGSVVKKQMQLVPAGDAASGDAAQISLDEAKAIALADAGLTAGDVTYTKAKLDLDDGRALYDVEFYTATHEYDYEIDADTGAIAARSLETRSAGPAVQPTSTPTPATSAQPTPTSAAPAPAGQPDNGAGLSLDEAKAIALADTGLNAGDVTYTKAKTDYDDGRLVYDVEFYTATHEYDYEIDADTGAVVSRSAEALPAPVSQPGASTYIGVDSAKAAAVAHAGFLPADVIFSKAKLEDDDGRVVYEVEFYRDGAEYEYTIHAVSGEILEYDVDWD